MTAHKNGVALARLFAEIVNGRDLDRFDELVAPDYINHNPYAEQGADGVKKVFGSLLAGVPDMRVVAEDVFGSADGTRVVGRYRYEGHQSGWLMGYPPSNAPFLMRSIDIWRLANGRFVEHWDELNTLEMFTTIGAARMLPAGA